MSKIICPISTERIDSNSSRLTIFINVILLACFLIFSNPIFIILVALDYFVRAALPIKYSPVRWIAGRILNLLRPKQKLIDLAPKIFASRLGFLCALAASILIFLGCSMASLITAASLMALATLDAVFNFCLGCQIYYYFVFPFYKK